MVLDFTRVLASICNVSIPWAATNAVAGQVSFASRKKNPVLILMNVISIGRVIQVSVLALIYRVVITVNVSSIKQVMINVFRRIFVSNKTISVVHIVNAFSPPATATIARYDEAWPEEERLLFLSVLVSSGSHHAREWSMLESRRMRLDAIDVWTWPVVHIDSRSIWLLHDECHNQGLWWMCRVWITC